MGWDIQPKYSPVGAGVEGSQKRGQLLKGIPSLGGWEDPPAEPAVSMALPARNRKALGNIKN